MSKKKSMREWKRSGSSIKGENKEEEREKKRKREGRKRGNE